MQHMRRTFFYLSALAENVALRWGTGTTGKDAGTPVFAVYIQIADNIQRIFLNAMSNGNDSA